FNTTNEKVKTTNAWLQLYSLDNNLKGHEIIIASSNNKAVENISMEIPGMSAIAADADDLRFFEKLSNHIFGVNTWGLISAALGNSSNRYNFSQKFWWDKDYGMAAYLSHICG